MKRETRRMLLLIPVMLLAILLAGIFHGCVTTHRNTLSSPGANQNERMWPVNEKIPC